MEITRLFEFIEYQAENFPQKEAFGYRKNGKTIFYSTTQIIDLSKKIARGLLTLGLQPGDKIALISYQNRPEWVIMDLGMLMAGMINVPVYPTISPREYEYIFNDAGVKYCFVGDGDLHDKVTKAKENIPTLKDIYTFDKQEGKLFWEDIFQEGNDDELQRINKTIHPNDLATIIYTSGTTGNPKGVMLSHNNIVSNVMAIRTMLPIVPGDRAISFLPLCHIFERVVAYAYMFYGVSVTFCATDNLGGEDGDLKAVKPHFFTTVPRLLEKVYEKIFAKGLELKGIKKSLFFWALSLTNDYEYDKEYTGLAKIKNKIADKLIFSKWREALGGNIKGIVTGAAPCPIKMARVFSAAGIPIREGYGMTESSPGIAINTFTKGGAMLGTVGPLIENVKVKIDTGDGDYKPGEGEILATGPNVMLGYYNKPLETADTIKEIDGERWLSTGDIGMIVTDNKGNQFLKITDRKKELLKTSGGKYVAPGPIESKMKENFLIDQIMVVGDNKKFVSALIVPAKESLKDWCEKNDIDWLSIDEAIKNPKIIEKYQEVIDKYNPNFSHIEQIKKFVLMANSWEANKIDGSEAELTPTMKLKRRVIMQKFQSEIENIYK